MKQLLVFLALIILLESLLDTVFELITGSHFDRAKDEKSGCSCTVSVAYPERVLSVTSLKLSNEHDAYAQSF